MKLGATLLVLGVGGLGFGHWGLNTPAGRSAFDEMAGIIPLAVGALGAALVLAGLVLVWRAARG